MPIIQRNLSPSHLQIVQRNIEQMEKLAGKKKVYLSSAKLDLNPFYKNCDAIKIEIKPNFFKKLFSKNVTVERYFCPEKQLVEYFPKEPIKSFIDTFKEAIFSFNFKAK